MKGDFFMSIQSPLDTLNLMVIFETKGLPYRNKTRLAVLAHICGHEIKSSLEIPTSTVNELLEIYFPNWQLPNSIPPEDSQLVLRSIAERCSQKLVEQLGTPEEFQAKIDALHAAKEADKAERIRQHDERQRIKKERKSKKTAQSAPATLPTTRTRRIFG